MENSFFHKVQRDNKYPFIYEAQQTVWEIIKDNLSSISTEFTIKDPVIDYEEAEDNLNLDEYNSNTNDEEITDTKAIELKTILEKNLQRMQSRTKNTYD
ncbi:8339_t:CDS:2 [Dentiscutata erythropus]|uniref:8339_t:CDS:1 n=1 Tax=Dentiscutata erythropus TaxID=1348616 RepID=A0A9N9AMZ7_9GLOM|nr:8339_t:CDS:2 [Dentiscutata erythropus]